jgi:hypothetical protein
MKVTGSVKTTGWSAGTVVQYDPSNENYVLVSTAASTGSAVTQPAGVLIDDETELSAIPDVTGGYVSIVQGPSKIFISHAQEVAAGSAVRLYQVGVESANNGAPLYWDATGSWTSTAQSNEAVYGVMVQKPAAANNYELGIRLVR